MHFLRHISLNLGHHFSHSVFVQGVTLFHPLKTRREGFVSVFVLKPIFELSGMERCLHVLAGDLLAVGSVYEDEQKFANSSIFSPLICKFHQNNDALE